LKNINLIQIEGISLLRKILIQEKTALNNTNYIKVIVGKEEIYMNEIMESLRIIANEDP